MDSKFSFATVILAAGASKRMRQPKLLLPWHRTTILGHLLEQWRSLASSKTVVVTAAGHQLIEAELDRLCVPLEHRIQNEDPAQGMFSSVRCAAAWPHWPPGLTHLVISLGDQPHLKARTLCGLLQFAAANRSEVCQPALHGRPRHPVVLPRNSFLAIACCPEQTLKEFLARVPVALWNCDDQGLDLDLDRPEDYTRALQLDISESA